MKTCSVCKTVKHTTSFHKDKSASDGLQCRCKTCNTIVCKKYRSTHRDVVRKISARRRSEKLASIITYNQKWNKRNYEARIAHQKVYRAVKTGKLVKPTSCERCRLDASRIEAHHDDYSKPLNVKWLCTLCHSITHQELKSA